MTDRKSLDFRYNHLRCVTFVLQLDEPANRVYISLIRTRIVLQVLNGCSDSIEQVWFSSLWGSFFVFETLVI